MEHAGYARLEEVLPLFGAKKSTWYNWIKDGKVPPPRKHPLAPGIKVYKRDEIQALLERLDREMEGAV